MAAIELPRPGTEYGPCIDDCQHCDCEETRRQAAEPCRVCPDPIGYGRPHYRDERGACHESCARQEAESAVAAYVKAGS